jgi:hypothetical protein
MKKCLIIICVITFLASCSDSFFEPVLPPAPPIEDGMGELRINLGSNSRTLMPSIFDAFRLYFIFTFTSQENGEIVIRTLNQRNTITVQLPIGIWDLEVTGFISEAASSDPSEVYVEGNSTGIEILSDKSLSVTVDLTPNLDKLNLTDDGTGILYYHINIPVGASGSLFVYDIDETTHEQMGLVDSVRFSSTEFYEGEITLPSGYYYIVVSARLGDKEDVWRERAHIFDDAITKAERIFTETDINSDADAIITQFSFSLANEFVFINNITKTIGVFVPPETDLANLAPSINFTGTMIIPFPGMPRDFSTPIEYDVYAENGAVSTYTIRVVSVFYSTAELHEFLNFFPGNTETTPLPIKINIDLSIYWNALLIVLLTTDVFVDLDISDSFGMSTFNPGATSAGKNRITSLVLPNDSTEIVSGTLINPSFNNFTVLRSISGRNIEDTGNFSLHNRGRLVSINFPALISIGNNAFSNNPLLREITMPDTVETIGNNAFSNNPLLREITIPETVETIGNNAFGGCSDLTVTIYTDIVKNWTPVFDNTLRLTVIFRNTVTSIASSAFLNNTGLVSIWIPESVASIGNQAFFGCTALAAINVDHENEHYVSIDGVLYNHEISTLIVCPAGKIGTVAIPLSVTTIMVNAFSGCTGIRAVNIPVNVETIGNNAFFGCTDITVTISTNHIRNWRSIFTGTTGLYVIFIDGVTSIGDNAFSGITGLVSVIIPNSVTAIGASAFSGCTGLISIRIPNSVTAIGASAFSGCTGLTSATILTGVSVIGDSAFMGCISLTAINIPGSVNTIGNSAFQNSTGLTTVNIVNGVTSIGNSAFSGCTGLTSITIPVSMTSIGNSAFSGCIRLTEVTIPANVSNIGTGVFSGTTNITVRIRTNHIRDWRPVFSNMTVTGTGFTTGLRIILESTIRSIDNSAFSGLTGLTSVTIPTSVTNIGNSAFSGCTRLANITIPENVVTMGTAVFSGITNLTVRIQTNNITTWSSIFSNMTTNGLTTGLIVILEDNITSIGVSAFSGLPGMTSITIPDGVLSIGTSAFQGNTRLNNVVIPGSVTFIMNSAFSGCTALARLTISPGVMSIGASAFLNCSALTSVTLPATVTAIGSSAFWGCNRLTSVTFQGTIEQSGYSSSQAFPGDLRVKYFAANGGPGTYTTTNPGTIALWVRR